MRQTGCFPAAFVVAVLGVFLASGALQREIYLSGINLDLKWGVVALVPLLLMAAAVVAFPRKRGRINRP